MKSQSCDAASSTTPMRGASILGGIRPDAGNRIAKSRPGRDSAITEEMQLYFSKLKELVPFMPKNKKVSKLEIIQHVIDYICDLQLALEAHPAARSATPSPTTSSPSRQPLGVITAPNALPNSCGAQEVCQHDKTSPHLDDMSTRPVSC